MIQYEEQRLRLLDNEAELKELAGALGLDMLRNEQERLEAQSAENGFWDDVENSQKILRKIAQLKNKIASYDNLKADYDDTLTLIELADEEEDLSLLDEAIEGVDRVIANIEQLRLTTLLSGEYDSKNAILTFHAGAGGTEAQDWVQMLYRMYHTLALIYWYIETICL